MPAIPNDSRGSVWRTRDGIVRSFHPTGRRLGAGERLRANRVSWEASDTYSARLFVGFNVGAKTVWEMDDLLAVVREVRERQTGNPASSFLYQKGIHKHQSGQIVEEPGAQVIVINMGSSPKEFIEQMLELAEQVADQLKQEEVVLEIQKNGLVERVFGVSAETA